MISFVLIYYLFAGLGVSFGLHRLLSHKSFKTPKWLERIVVTLSLPAGTPIQWAGNHRYHHAHTDVDGDPHSPNLDGFFYAHVGWYLGSKNRLICLLYMLAGPFRIVFDSYWRPRTNQQYNYLAKDVARDAYYSWVSRPYPYMFMMFLHFIIPTVISVYLAGLQGFLIFWGTLVFIYNVSDAIDSVSHLFGEMPYKSKDKSRNHIIMGLLTLGEGWHANHHRFPNSAKFGLLKNQFDFIWLVISFLKIVGLAKDINVPNDEVIRGKLNG